MERKQKTKRCSEMENEPWEYERGMKDSSPVHTNVDRMYTLNEAAREL